MIIKGILNPQINSLLCRVRHTNTIVIADRGFPFWPEIETIDISLVDGIPTVLQVLAALRPNFMMGKAFMSEEFRKNNRAAVQKGFSSVLQGVKINYEPHVDFKKRIPGAIGLIRTADITRFANIIIESA